MTHDGHIPVNYHGSVKEGHGLGLLLGCDPDKADRFIVRVSGGDLVHVRRESFTIIDDDPANAVLAEKFAEVSA